MGIEELIATAKRRGITTLSVTDHDTTAAATRAVIIGRRQGLRVIYGVEVSTIDSQRKKGASAVLSVRYAGSSGGTVPAYE